MIQSRPTTKEYRSGWENTFGPKPTRKPEIDLDTIYPKDMQREIRRLLSPNSRYGYESGWDRVFGKK